MEMRDSASNMRLVKWILGTLLVFDLLRCCLALFGVQHASLDGLIIAFCWYPGVPLAVPLLWRIWRNGMMRLVRAWSLTPKSGFWWTLLLGGVLLAQLAYFYSSDARGSWPSYSTVWPAFLAGPLLALLTGIIPLMQRDSRSISGFLLLGMSVTWLLLPLALDMEYYFGKDQGWTAEEHIPVLSIALYSSITYSILGYAFLKLLFYPAIALGVGLPLLEWVKGRCSFPTALACIMAGFAFLPFLYEWTNHLID